MNKKEFVEKAKKLYGEKYDYKFVPEGFLNNYDNIPIICEKHGLFYQTVYQFLNGNDCLKCKLEKNKMTDIS